MMKITSARGLFLLLCLLGIGPFRPALAETAVDSVKPLQAIEFGLAQDNLQQFATPLDVAAIAERVRANLTEWEFPLAAKGPYSHRLQAKLGKIAHRETPVGFSFSSGNSDPRASDFQKADVLPITCTLRDAGNQAVLVERESTFSAHALDKDVLPARIVDKLVDQIGTACLDVLEYAPLPKQAGRVKTELFKPKWMPDVRVEVREVKGAVDANGVAQPAAVGDEPKKEIIIHNQGTPVIFQFGHERK
ncbi:hypothetical protein [Methylomonas albis]|uniref:Uncharacterized protein n=1 Tax=Methylomonas albis TaxID=1854563 RepID=A0ABR9CX95_9GAMM|nr:hypothetical protein [Methylomonas albis]MBD9355512.1 hypothetical protein [Methylomonas albis]CAD6878509.1 hypothetical protein [Methylomonas albis]